MVNAFKILGFAASLRKESYNKVLLGAALEIIPEDVELEVFNLEGIPSLNQELENEPDVMESLSPMDRPSTVKDIRDAVMYLTDAATITGDILCVDGGFHFGHW